LRACRHPLLARARARQREALRQAPAREVDAMGQATTRTTRQLTGPAAMTGRVEPGRQRCQRGPHCQVAITDTPLRYTREPRRRAADAALAGVSVVRTRVSGEPLSPERPVGTSQRLAAVERALRSLKTVALYVRPIGQRLAERVRTHGFLGMFAYDVEWHRRQARAPLLFDADDKAAGEARRAAGVAPVQRAPRAQRRPQRTDEGLPLQSGQTRLDDLAPVTHNRSRLGASRTATTMFTTPTPLQPRACDLLQVSLTMEAVPDLSMCRFSCYHREVRLNPQGNFGSTHGVFARAVRLALPPVLREPRDGKSAPPAEPMSSPSCRTSVVFLADM
jgi:hypothetical protein